MTRRRVPGEPPRPDGQRVAAHAVPGGWTDAELATFTHVVATLAEVDEPQAWRIALASAERMARFLDPDQVRGLRLVLWMLELPLVGRLSGGPARAFSRRSALEREQELRRWATSRFRWRRTSFQAFKRLACFRAYADPSPAGRPNPLLADIGYAPPLEPVTAAPTQIAAFALPEPGPGGTIELAADVVVVGSGAGGGVVARELAAAGRDVVVLEAGPLVREPEMPTDEASAHDRLFLDGSLTSTRNGSVTIAAGRGVGGGTTVNWTTCIEPAASVRALWARVHGIDGLDGGAADDDLAILYSELAITGPPNIPPKDRLVLDGAAALGVAAGPANRNAVDCGDCGSCGFGCRRGAKQSTLRVHLAHAWADGARIVPDATVHRVSMVDGGVEAVEASVTTAAGQRRLRVRAGQVVIAAGALRTPGILERSGVDHPALGRYLRLHPVAVLAAVGRGPVEMWRGTPQAAHSLAWAPGTSRAADHAGFTIESMPAHPGALAVTLPWRSGAEFAGVMRRARFVSPIIAITRDSGWGTVRQSRTGWTRIEYPLDAGAVRTLRAGLVAAADLARAGGATAILAPGEPAAAWAEQAGDLPGATREWGVFRAALDRFDYDACRGVVLSAHQLGSARMGAVAADHPVDPDGHVRMARRRGHAPGSGDGAIRGLYVADGSLFPTGIGVNPMVTIMLLARRVTRTVLAEGPA